MGILQESRLIHRRHQPKPKGWLEEWLDLSFVEKLISIMWCGMPYLIWLMSDGLDIMYKIPISIGVWILLTLCCYWFGTFMASDQRHWN